MPQYIAGKIRFEKEINEDLSEMIIAYFEESNVKFGYKSITVLFNKQAVTLEDLSRLSELATVFHNRIIEGNVSFEQHPGDYNGAYFFENGFWGIRMSKPIVDFSDDEILTEVHRRNLLLGDMMGATCEEGTIEKTELNSAQSAMISKEAVLDLIDDASYLYDHNKCDNWYAFLREKISSMA